MLFHCDAYPPQPERLLPQHRNMERSCFAPADPEAVSSELEQNSERICLLEQVELKVTQRLGMSGEDIDSDAVLLASKQGKCSDSEDVLRILQKLHCLRLQDSRARKLFPVEPETHSYPSGIPYHVDASRFFALIIVRDAQLMQEYLTEDLGVPRARIQLLVGSKEHASPNDPMNPSQIAFGDNVIIFYSGHGACYPSHAEEGDAVVPSQISATGNSTGILTQISRAKGDRIMVILDCCHSGSLIQDLPEPGARTSPPMMCATLQDMLMAGENALRGFPGYRSIMAKDWTLDMSSHVVLAACRGYQFAKPKKVMRDDGTGDTLEFLRIPL
ncbi:uncharacterized protein EV420DRAFT_1639498 [Desarmillaria tabescens]|uniref:Metacaspase n=1 Tax=Armillaria tabescens TaxID=1929756 RepID=A0AA39NAZ5_ARMTA|nr:uncharacterized protein EV420DRAFT_1639498 [Desarmillaria tabescens]KAK0462288.1 hypothetical protein EV420DRAFT_1639498 [Desarmillaria tabescens]